MKRAKKLYIQNVEKILKVDRKTLYYWEKVGKIPKSRRETMSNYRYWMLADVKKIQRIIAGKAV